jgi:hypothetical protein
MSAGKVVAIIVGVLLACLLVLGGLLWFSAQRIQEHAQVAMGAVDELTAALDKLDSERILTSSQTITDEVDAIQREADGVPWRIAGALPIVNEDVGIARQALTITNTLTDNALMPMAQSYDQLSKTLASSTFSLDSLGSNVNALQDLSDKLVQAGDVLVTARKDASALGASHFDAINQAVAKMRELLDKASELYESNEQLVKGVQSFLGAGSDILGALLGGSDSGPAATTNATPNATTGGSTTASQTGASLPAAA